MVFKTVNRIAKEFLKLSISHKEKVTAICWVLLQSELIVLNFLAEGYLLPCIIVLSSIEMISLLCLLVWVKCT